MTPLRRMRRCDSRFQPDVSEVIILRGFTSEKYACCVQEVSTFFSESTDAITTRTRCPAVAFQFFPQLIPSPLHPREGRSMGMGDQWVSRSHHGNRREFRKGRIASAFCNAPFNQSVEGKAAVRHNFNFHWRLRVREVSQGTLASIGTGSNSAEESNGLLSKVAFCY